jgi:hypothetical protein
MLSWDDPYGVCKKDVESRDPLEALPGLVN